MRSRDMRTRNFALLAVVLALGTWLALNRPAPSQDPPDQQRGVEVLARGPVHEAFAEPTSVRPEPAPLVKKQPPEMIEEQPPDEKPEGSDVVWIPGYWAWDDDNNEYIWVSGFWRERPPGRTWVSGYWMEVDGGWQW